MGMRSVSEVEVSFVRLGRSFFYERLAVLARVLSACWCTEGIVFCVNENSRPEEGCSVPRSSVERELSSTTHLSTQIHKTI